jgi:protein-L-isoaspartate(D-aspartate) O-methyltransferase
MSEIGPDTLRHDYAHRIAQLADIGDMRIEQAFAEVPRENFLPPPPWTIISLGDASKTSRLADIYENVLVAIDRQRGINNGEPTLHAIWLEAVSPQAGESVVHVGAGTGYYTAMLSRLVEPGGHVEAFEYEADLAAEASRNLRPYANVTVHAESAVSRKLPEADVIYVNAGVIAPDAEWLKALKPNGRLIFPWQPHKGWGPALLVRRHKEGFAVRALMNVGFISCSGTKEKLSVKHLPTEADLVAVRSVWLKGEAAPDNSAVAVYDQVWFSSKAIVR